MTTTSNAPDLEARVERRRQRLETLLQVTRGDFDLRLGFNRADRIGEGEIVMKAQPAEVAGADYAALRGGALHLLGHQLCETAAFGPLAAQAEAEGKPGFSALWHALEDARLENWMIRRWPGMDRAFRARLLPDLDNVWVGRMPIDRQVELGLYLHGRGERRARLSEAVGRTLENVAPWVEEGASGESGEASLLAMHKIYPAIAALLTGGGSQSRPPSQARGRRTGTEETPPGPRGPTPQATGLPEITLSDEQVQVGVLGRRRELPEWYRPGSAPWFERGLGGKQVHPEAVRSDRATRVRPGPGDPHAYHALWREVRREVGPLETRLTRFLREQAYLRYGGRFRSGKLHAAKLWKQRLGTYRLFERQVEQETSTAFTLLVDESASMKAQNKSRLAAMTAIVLGEALDRVDVPLEIIGYTTAEFEAKAALRLGLTPAHAYRSMRCSPLEHRIYKGFDEEFRVARFRLSEIAPRRNNWDEESLWFAFRRIQARGEKAKVIVVISDGQPNGDADHLIACVETVERLGCQVIGIGLGADYVRQIYRHSIVVSDFRQMADELMRLLARELVGGPVAGRDLSVRADQADPAPGFTL